MYRSDTSLTPLVLRPSLWPRFHICVMFLPLPICGRGKNSILHMKKKRCKSVQVCGRFCAGEIDHYHYSCADFQCARHPKTANAGRKKMQLRIESTPRAVFAHPSGRGVPGGHVIGGQLPEAQVVQHLVPVGGPGDAFKAPGSMPPRRRLVLSSSETIKYGLLWGKVFAAFVVVHRWALNFCFCCCLRKHIQIFLFVA